MRKKAVALLLASGLLVGSVAAEAATALASSDGSGHVQMQPGKKKNKKNKKKHKKQY